MKIFATAIAAALAISGSAMADLTGTTMTMSVNHAGSFSAISAITNVTYTYGSPSAFVVPGWGTLNVTSPVSPAPPGLANSLKLDFTAFNYSAFSGPFATTGTVKLINLAEGFDLSSVQILVNGANIATGVAAVGNGFQASWSTQAVFNANPVNPNVVVAWNSVPGPGALALMGLAGIAPRRRRRS